ncbi:MAG: DUF502 domain-containing protein [Phycisphaerales bacterium]
MARKRKSFMSDFRTFFLRGLGILLPSILTLALLVWAYGFLHNNVAKPINSLIRGVTLYSMQQFELPTDWRPGWYTVTGEEIEGFKDRNPKTRLGEEQIVRELRVEGFREFWSSHWYLESIGVIVAIILIYLAGVLVGNYLGRRLYVRAEKLLTRVPVVKQVYPSVKQIVDFLLGDGTRKLDADRVVLVEYPREGIWTVGLLTGPTMRVIEEITGAQCVTVFIPSSPTPFTGYTITVPRRDVVELPISLDEAIKFVVSGGVLIPPRQVIGGKRDIARPISDQEEPKPNASGHLASEPNIAMMEPRQDADPEVDGDPRSEDPDSGPARSRRDDASRQ